MRTVAVTGQATGTINARRTTATRSTATVPATTRTTAFRKGAAEGARPATAGGGRGGMSVLKRAMKSSGGDFNRFTVDEGTKYVIAFLEDGPFEVVWVHWCKVKGDDGSIRPTPRNCPTTKDEDAECPLCEMGVEAKPVAYFNIMDLDQPSKVFLWEAGKDAAGRVEKLYDELQGVPADRGGPLELNSEGVFAVVSKEKLANKRFAYAAKRVKERDLDEDYQLDAPAPEAYEALSEKLYTSEIVKYNTTEELREFAATLED